MAPKQDIAVIIGVGPGLGLALAQACANAGMTVFAAARNAHELAGLREGGQAQPITPVDCDATQPQAVASLFAQVGQVGTPDLVIFNAGAYQPGKITEISPEDFERCWRVGCYAGFLVGQAAARAMLPKRQGTILFTGATASLRGSAGFANLAVPKFGLRALAQSMARELGPEGIHVGHVIIDGQIMAPRYQHLADERGPDSLLEPDAIAAAYLDLHRQHRSAWTHELDLRPWRERF
ncbi:MAG: SDR family NAD(P)-dependent oxidoreductase [Sphingomonadales bacterium]